MDVSLEDLIKQKARSSPQKRGAKTPTGGKPKAASGNPLSASLDSLIARKQRQKQPSNVQRPAQSGKKVANKQAKSQSALRAITLPPVIVNLGASKDAKGRRKVEPVARQQNIRKQGGRREPAVHGGVVIRGAAAPLSNEDRTLAERIKVVAQLDMLPRISSTQKRFMPRVAAQMKADVDLPRTLSERFR